MRLNVAIAVSLFAAASFGAGEQSTAAAIRRTTDIPAQGLGPALKTLATERDFQIVYASDEIGGLRTQGAAGELTADEALMKLLNGTGLSYRYLDDKTVTVYPTESGSEPAEIKARPSEAANVEPSAEAKKNFFDRFRLAQADRSGRATASEEGQARTTDAAQSFNSQQIGEVIVTGTHIRGEAPAGSKVVTVTRDELDASGHARLEDYFETLPQNFSGSSSADSSAGTNYNVNRATGVDLRGLGNGTTLVLVNGHRQPGGDFFGSFVDISSIPSSAVERIEILTDGASAVYGSDAIGGVVNFLLRKDYEGAESRLRLGTLDGNADEVQLAQLFGKSWSSGNAILGYQYYERDPVHADDIDYLATNGDQRRLGGSDFRDQYMPGTPGIILDPDWNPGFAIPRGQDGRGLTVGDLTALDGALPDDFPLGANEDKWYLDGEKLHTLFFSATQRVSEEVELFAEARYAARDMDMLFGGAYGTWEVPSTNPYYLNPYGGTDPVVVSYNFHDDGLVVTSRGDADIHAETVGLKAELNGWNIVLSGSYGKQMNRIVTANNIYSPALDAALESSDPNTAVNLFGSGSNANSAAVIDSFRSSQLRVGEATVWGTDVVADGTLVSFAGRDIRLALGSSYRAESFDFRGIEYLEFPEDTRADRAASKSRDVTAVFAELAIPLVADSEDRFGLQRLELSLAARYEDYSDFGTTTNPRIGLRWQPIDVLQLRGTWGTSFKAPKLIELAEGYVNNLVELSQQIRFNPQTSDPDDTWWILGLQAPDPNLREETADVWTAGFDFVPNGAAGPRVSFSYFDIDYTDKISFIGGYQVMQSPEAFAAYSDYIIYPVTQAEVDALCDSSPGTCTGLPIGAIVRSGLHNLSAVLVSGFDLDVGQTLRMNFGTFDLSVGGTRLTRYDEVVVDGIPALDVLNTVGHPTALRLRGRLAWSFQEWGAGIAVNHVGSYDDPTAHTKVDALTTVDLNISYQTASTAGWLANTRLILSAVNVSDELPPFVNNPVGYDAFNGDVMGRKLNLQLIKDWGR